MIRRIFRMRNVVAVAICLAASCGLMNCKPDCDKTDPKSSCYVPDTDKLGDKRIKDKDGNIYTEVTIGAQTWLKENMKTTTYQDGTPITNMTSDAAWASAVSGGYCWYNNSESNKNTYGALYNFYVANSGKICPEGWHVPSTSDWHELINNCGKEATAGIQLKEAGTTHWVEAGGTNASGFTALPGGQRTDDGTFYSLHDLASFWTVIQISANDAEKVFMEAVSNSASVSSTPIKSGLSIRCIKNE